MNLKFSDHIQNDDKSMLEVQNTRLNALREISSNASFTTRKNSGQFCHNVTYDLTNSRLCWMGKVLDEHTEDCTNKMAHIVAGKGKDTDKHVTEGLWVA